MILKQIFDFNLFSKVMKEHLDRQQRALTEDHWKGKQALMQENAHDELDEVEGVQDELAKPLSKSQLSAADAASDSEQKGMEEAKNEMNSVSPSGIYTHVGTRTRKIKKP